jgi:hypothetical protein
MTALLVVILVNFCADFNVSARDCNAIKFSYETNETMPVIADPKGARPAHGYCLDGTIGINVDHWSEIDYWEKWELGYHELGHCLLFILEHRDDVSIMNPFPPHGSYWVSDGKFGWFEMRELMIGRYNGRIHDRSSVKQFTSPRTGRKDDL